MKAYFDNAATTRLDNEVIEAMTAILKDCYGNPSSIHGFGREARSHIEKARKTVATLMGCSPAEIFFTSGGTEANNTAIKCSVRDLDVKRIITSELEHHAVFHTAENIAHTAGITLDVVKLTPNGSVDLEHLEELLKNGPTTLVSLMHANNEIGNLLPLQAVSELCGKYAAYLHSDTVQTVGHYSHDLKAMPNLHFLSSSAHKFHGPKGIGFLYINSNVKIKPFIDGGAQERNMRGGTENIYGIVGLAKALEIACRDMEKDHAHIQGLKTKMIEGLRTILPDVKFNGGSEDGLYTVLNVSLPPSDISEMLLFKLDIEGIAASGGSACSSGSNVGSHVLKALNCDPERPSVRFSFSKYNTAEEVDYVVSKLKVLFGEKVVA